LVRVARGSRRFFEDNCMRTKRYYTESTGLIPVSLPLLVQDVLEDSDDSCSVLDAFPLNANVFISSAESRYYGFAATITQNDLETKGTLTVSCKLPSTADASFYDILVNYDNYALKWYSAHDIARFLHITADVVSRITGCVFVSLDDPSAESSRNRPVNKVNIGLELKFSKREQILEGEVCGPIRNSIIYRFSEVFKYLEKVEDFMAYIRLNQLFPNLNEAQQGARFEGSASQFPTLLLFCGPVLYTLLLIHEHMHIRKSFLRSTAPKDSLEPASGIFMDSKVIKEVERRISACRSGSELRSGKKMLAVKPRAAELCRGAVAPDLSAQFRLLDRVVCVKRTCAAPFGEFGTVIGLLCGGTEEKVDVLFDKPYFGGKSVRFVRFASLLFSSLRSQQA
uniref:SH3_12 domain-containing protein n=1 Tax=Gongylonema pulchrum TaxID=637853 RepID=A0A183E898_9BILA